MATHSLDIAVFRAMFAAFQDETTYPDPVITLWWMNATAIMGSEDGPLIDGAQLQLALNYLTAHLMWSSVLLAQGQTTVAVVSGATIDKVTVTLAPPPFKDGWQWWLSSTPYGAALWALLEMASGGGFYISGGLPERDAFRRVGGGFGPRRW